MCQTKKPRELIVVDQSSSDALGHTIAGLGNSGFPIRYLWKPELAGLTEARNYGFDESSGSIVLFLDDDVVLSDCYLEKILEIYAADADCSVGGVGGVDILTIRARGSRFYRWFWRGPFYDARDEFQANPTEYFESNALFGCNMSYRREAYDRHRSNEHLSGYSYGEDWELGKRISRSARLVLTSEAPLEHRRSPLQRLPEDQMLRMALYNMRFYYFTLYGRSERATWRNRLAVLWFRTGCLAFALARLKSRKVDVAAELVRAVPARSWKDVERRVASAGHLQ
jgi:glycosyltransferase involved in cell wall biosynthesis